MSGSSITTLALGQNSLQKALLPKVQPNSNQEPEAISLTPEEVLELQIKTIKGEIEAHDDSVTALEMTQDSKYIISGSEDKAIKVWDTLLKKSESILVGHIGGITCLSLSSDNKYLLSGAKGINAGSEDSEAKLWDFENRIELATFRGHSGQINGVAFAEDLKYVLTCSDDKIVKVWDYQGNLMKDLIEHNDRVTCCIAVNSYAISGSSNGSIFAWDLKSFCFYKEIHKASQNIVSLCASSDGNLFASAEKNDNIQVWDGNSLELKFELKDTDEIKIIRFSGNSEFLVVVSDNCYVYLWKIELRQRDFSIRYFPKVPISLCVNKDCSIVVNGFSEKVIRIWNSCERRDESTIYIHDDEVLSITCTSDERYLISGSFDKTLKIYDLETKTIDLELKQSEPNTSKVYSLDRFNNIFLSSHEDGSVKFWDLNSMKQLKSVKSHDDIVWSIAISEEYNLASSGSDDKKIVIWDLNSLDQAFILSESTHSALCLIFLKKSLKLLSGGDDFLIKKWDIDQRVLEKTFSGHTDFVFSLTLSPEEDYLYSSSYDKTIKLWDMNNFSVLHTFEGHQGGVRKIILMSTEKTLISAAYDKVIKFWNIDEKKLNFTLEGHTDFIRTMIINKNETKLISGGDDSIIIIWNISTKLIDFKLSGHSDFIRGLILVNENYLISCSEDKLIISWDLELKKQKELLYYEFGQIYTVAISSNNSSVVFGDSLGRVFILDLLTKTTISAGGHKYRVMCVSISNDSKLIASGSSDKSIKIWDIENSKEEMTLTDHSDKVLSVAFNHNSKFLISGSSDNSFKIWNIQTKNVEQTFSYSKSISCLVSSKKQNLAYFSCKDSNIRAVNLSERKIQFSTTATYSIHSMILDPSEKMLIYHEFNLIIIFDTLAKKVLYKLHGHSRNYIYGLVYLPNNKKIISCSKDKSIKIWKLKNNREMKTVKFENDIVNIMDITTDKEFLVCGLNGGEIKIWKIADRSLYFRVKGHSESIWSIKISSNNKIFASGSNDNLIKIWSICDKKLLFSLAGHTSWLKGILFSENDKILVSCSLDKTIRFWNLFTQKEENKLEEHLSSLFCIYMYNDLIFSGSDDGKIVVWECKKKKNELVGHNGDVNCITSAGERLISGSDDKTIKVWRMNDNSLIFTLSSHTNIISALLVMNDTTLISSSYDKTIISWDIENQKPINTYKGHNDDIYSLVKLNENKFMSSSWDKTLKIWDIEDKENFLIFIGVTSSFIALYNTSDFLFIGSENGLITVFDLNEEKECKILWGHTNTVTSFEIYENESILISGSRDYTIKFWDLKTETLIDTKKVHSNWVRCLRISPNQNYLISSSVDNTIIIWLLPQRNIYKIIRGHKNGVLDIRISKDSSYFFSSSEDFSIKMWDLESGKERCCFLGHKNSVWRLILIEEQKILISCSTDKLIKFWDYESQREIFNLQENTEAINTLEISQNQKYLISGSNDETVKIWNILERRLEYTLQGDSSSIMDLLIIQDRNIFCSCSKDGILKFWRIKPIDSTKLKQINCEKKSFICNNSFLLDEKQTISQTNSCSNDFQPNHAFDIGFNDTETFYSLVDSLKENSFSNFMTESSSLKISSCLFGVAHILAFLDKEKELSDLLSTKNIIFNDIFGRSPFYYAIIKKHYKCSEIILDFLINSSQKMDTQDWESSIYSIRNDFHLILSHSIYQIGKFLKYSMISSQSTFLSSSVSLPCSVFSNYSIPIPKDFNDSADTEKNQVYFMTFQLPLAIISGSEETAQLLNSILVCQDREIFSSGVIKEFIDNQWNSDYGIIVFNSFTMFFNILVLVCILVYGLNWFLAFPFIFLNFILACWEILQLIVSPSRYFEEIWNWIDVIRLTLTIAWLFYIESNILELNIAVVFFNFIRGLTAFKVFDGTRYYIKLILNSIDEIKYFLVMFAYANITLGTLYSLRSSTEKKIISSIFEIYNINFGYFETDELLNYFDFAIFISATIFNLIIMLNLLISILADFHDQFQFERIHMDYQEKAETCLEIQNLLFWKRKYYERGFLHKAVKVGQKEESDTWEGKIHFFKTQITGLSSTVNDLNVNITEKITKNIETTGIDIKEKFETNLRENNIKIDENHIIIETKVKEVSELIEKNQKGNDESIKSIESKIREVYELIESKERVNNETIKIFENKIEGLESKVDSMNKQLTERLNLMENGIFKILEKLNS